MSTTMRGLITALVIMMGLMLAPAPAFGHASQVGSSPAADEALDVAPREVRIDFDSGLLDMGAALIVRDAEGASVTTGPAVVGDRTFSVPVDPMAPAGVYEVAYRVVSADGHTIEDSFSYTVTGNSTEPSTPGSGPDAPEQSAPASQQPTTTTEATDSTGLPIVWIIGGAVILILAIGAALMWRR